MQLIKTELQDAFIIEPKVFGDRRGWFCESYSKRVFEELGIFDEFVQDNKSFSACKGTLRGLHCQRGEDVQSKLVSCVQGVINDVIVDVRRGSPTYMKHITVQLSAENKRMLYVPEGFLHGFVTLSDDVVLSYKVNRYYSAENDRSVRFDDPAFGIDWGDGEHILSDKDINAPLYCDSDVYFEYGKTALLSY